MDRSIRFALNHMLAYLSTSHSLHFCQYEMSPSRDMCTCVAKGMATNNCIGTLLSHFSVEIP